MSRAARHVGQALVAAAGILGVSVAGEPPTWAVAVFPSGAQFDLEIASTPDQVARGYMERDHVGADEGMLFLFERKERHSFWMKNCRVSLDIVWLDERLRVVDIARAASPCPATGACPGIVPARPSRYVLEVAAGRTFEEDLKLGDAVVVLSEPPLR